MSYREITVRVTTTGSAGAASGSAKTDAIKGEIVEVFVNYNGSAPVTTKVDIDEVGGANRKILNKAAGNTDAVHYPRVQMQDTTGAPIAGIHEPIALAGRAAAVNITLSDALTDAVVTLIVRKD